MARGSWVPSELESRLSVWVVAEMMAQPGCLIGHRGVEARAGACRWQAPRSSRVDYVCTGLASTGERSPGRKPRLGFRVRSTNERWVATWVARHRPGRDSNPGVQTAKINALLLRKRPETYRAGNYSATHKKSRWRAGSRSNPARLAREASFRAMWSADRHHVPRSPGGGPSPRAGPSRYGVGSSTINAGQHRAWTAGRCPRRCRRRGCPCRSFPSTKRCDRGGGRRRGSGRC
jgi:hypothetical protein